MFMPSTPRFNGTRPVLVPLGAERHRAAVVGAAADLCAGLGARAVLLDVVPAPDALRREVRICGRPVDAVVRDDGHAHLQRFVAVFREAGVAVDLSVHEGDLLESILSETVGSGAQLIVMGACDGSCPVADCSSVVDAVVEAALVPVMVVTTRPGGTDASDGPRVPALAG